MNASVVRRMLRHAIGIAALVLLSACSAGPSESEFAAACMKEGERGINSALRREVGANTAAFCECAAAQAASTLSPEARRALILDMEGRKREARAISSSMSDADQAALFSGGVAIMVRCTEVASATGAGTDRASRAPVDTGRAAARPGPATAGRAALSPARAANASALFGRYRAEYGGESITLDFRSEKDVRVILADRSAVLDTAQGSYEVRNDNVTVRVPNGNTLVLTRRGDALEGVMDGDKIRFERR